MASMKMLSSAPTVFAKRYSGSSAATIGSIFVVRKKNITSRHFSTGRIESANAAGKASTRTSRTDRSDAVNELSSGGQGLIPDPPKKARKPSSRSEEHTSELQSRENLVC